MPGWKGCKSVFVFVFLFLVFYVGSLLMADLNHHLYHTAFTIDHLLIFCHFWLSQCHETLNARLISSRIEDNNSTSKCCGCIYVSFTFVQFDVGLLLGWPWRRVYIIEMGPILLCRLHVMEKRVNVVKETKSCFIWAPGPKYSPKHTGYAICCFLFFIKLY